MKTKNTQKSGSRNKTKKPRSTLDNTKWVIPPPAKSNAGKIVLATLSIGAAGVIGYFGWQYYKKKKEGKSSNLDNELLKIHPNTTPVTDATNHSSYTDSTYTPPVDTTGKKSGKSKSSSSGDDFPLKKGSKGDNVRQLQQALISKYGSSILPKYGADGDFGSETQNALKKKGLPTVVSESTFNVITQGVSSSSGGSDMSALAGKLYDAATAKNINTVVSLLKNINNKDDYQQVSNAFMEKRLHGVRQTLVNGLLGSFNKEDQKQKIRMEFIRIGLQYDGSKWTLSGFDGKPIVTKEPATVWVNATESVQVPALMVLGNEVTQRLDYTLFENNNKYFLVKTQSLKYL